MFYTPRKSEKEKSPRKTPTSPSKTEAAGPSPRTKNDDVSKVRRSIGEWEKETGKSQPKNASPVKPTLSMAASLESKLKTMTTQESKGATRRPSVEALGESQTQPQHPKDQPRPTDRVTQARNWLRKAKAHLSDSRNLRADLKIGITAAVEELYKLVKEEAEEKKKAGTLKKDGTYIKEKTEKGTMTTDINKKQDNCAEAIKMLEWQKEKIEATYTEMVKIRETVTSMQNNPPTQTRSYAETVMSNAKTHREPALHSVLIASRDTQDTGDQVLERVRKAVNAKDGWVTVERVRKIKDRKVIVGCRTKEEREKLKERLKSVEDHLHVEEVKNQDPMLVLRGVLSIHTDEDILKALRNQNEGVFRGLDVREDRMEVRYRRTMKNPHTRHVVIRVSPVIYNRMLEKGRVHIDIQNIRVEDQSPLVQCSMCLGYGHGKRFCKETVPKCSHCGGLHLRDKCPDWISGAAPCCTNCTEAKLEETNHNAFSEKCPIRRRWEALARAKIAYC